MFDQRNDAEPKSYVVFAVGRILPVILTLPVIVGVAMFGCGIYVPTGIAVTVVDVLKPKCLTCTLESAGGAEVNVIVVPDVV